MQRFIVLIVFVMSFCTAQAQQKEQLWVEFAWDRPFANQYVFEVLTSYRTVFASDRWRSLEISPTLDYSMLTWLDLTGEVTLAYTLQQTNSNSLELSPMVGGRFYITQGKRIDTRALVRYQQRYFRQVEEDDWDVSNRVRLRGEVYFCINGPNLFTDKLWYTLLDYEEFVVIDRQLDERYANRRRLRMGLAYRLNYKNRFELSFTLQRARNEIGDEFVATDNVIQFRYKMYVNPSRTKSSDN